MTFEELLHLPAFSLDQPHKQAILLEQLKALTEWHRARCQAYQRLVDLIWPRSAESPAEVPYLPVGLFKSHRLVSVPDDQIAVTLMSSGTTGQRVSRIFLDRITAQRQTLALGHSMSHLLGRQRLPMVLVETRSLMKDRSQFSARGAGVLGMMNFGREHFWALDEDMRLDTEGLRRFLIRYGNAPFLLFGFTFMVWQYLYKPIERLGLDLTNGILVHSGGWKKLQDEAVDNAEFKRRLFDATGVRRVFSFYGMVEQVGSVFLEGEDGYLYTSNFSDVIVRDPLTWREAPAGRPGVLQVVSALPLSYPGHSILTEDLGVLHGIDDSPSGRRGKYFSVLGRVPSAELRGCSDTHAYGSNA
jgi:acyl-CoA synthetase (AMP-forming)/AMP-acid ligase II